jgi:hypothetical protein
MAADRDDPGGFFLERLAAGTTTRELRRAAAQLRRAGVTEERVRRLLAMATEVQRRLAATERDAQLAALYDTAYDLASLTDLDAVLQAIARRARTLLTTDVAYLSLMNEAGTATYVRVADGFETSEMLDLEVPPGVGLDLA